MQDRFLRAADIIANNAQQEELAVVLSAPGKTTNKLVAVIEAAKMVKLTHRLRDRIFI